MDLDDIESMFLTPIRSYKSGKFICLRVNIPYTKTIKKEYCMIYDETEKKLDSSDVNEEKELIPLVLVGSVMGGVASVVEAGAITALVALFTGVFVYRTIKWKDCTGAFRRAFRNSAMVFIIIAASGPFSWLLTSLGAIGDLETWLLGLADSPILFVLALILFIFLLGTVMDSAVNIIIVGPVLVNVMSQAGFPEVQAAMVVIVGFLIGSVTPPVGVAYFTSATIAQVRLEKVAIALIPYLIGLFLLLFFILIVPQLTMFLPNLLSN